MLCPLACIVPVLVLTVFILLPFDKAYMCGAGWLISSDILTLAHAVTLIKAVWSAYPKW
jgi:uncharacterized membrane protein YkgB